MASQTLESLRVIESTSDYPVLRPLICFDKVETVRLAQQIGTYDISILPYEDCCSVFVPKHPVTKPRPDVAEQAERLLDVEALAKECAANTEVFDLDRCYRTVAALSGYIMARQVACRGIVPLRQV